MAHFAEIGTDDRVIRVLVVPDERARWGHKFLSQDLGLGGEWVQTSYNARIRGKFAGIGDTYDRENDLFVAPEEAPEEEERPAEEAPAE